MTEGLASLTVETIEETVEKNDTTLKLNKKLDNKNTKVDKEQYTISPDGKYKIPVSSLDSDRIEENRFNIPTIKIAGWIVVWPTDIKANTIPSMVAKGYQFVNPNDPGCEAAARKIPAGRTQGGETAFHYAMKIPESKYKELMAREEAERSAMESSIKHNPTGQYNPDFYGTGQTNFSRSGVLGAKMN